MDAKTIQENRVSMEIKNHSERVAWLEGDNPSWSDGVPLSPFDRVDLLRQSREFLSNNTVPNDVIQGTRSGPAGMEG